jgi:hypothetical protein
MRLAAQEYAPTAQRKMDVPRSVCKLAALVTCGGESGLLLREGLKGGIGYRIYWSMA